MGIYDREYYRGDESPTGIQLAGQWTMVTRLVVANVAVFLLNVLLSNDNWLNNTLSASPITLLEPWRWWQLLTYGFAHDSLNISHIFFNMFILWMFGREIERIYGGQEFLRVYLVTVVLGGIVWCATQLLTTDSQTWNRSSLIGASGAVTAVILLFCLHFPNRKLLLMLVLPVPAWFVGAMIIGVNIFGFGGIGGGEQIAYDVHLVGAAFAICYFKFGWNLGRWFPALTKPKGGWFRKRPKLRIHDPQKTSQNLDDEADRLLQKVNRDGIDSLSSKERRMLEDYSRRMQQKHR